MSDEQPMPLSSPSPSEIAIHFIKGTQFRVVHANGAWFGSDPQGNIHLTFYSERSPIPAKVVVKLNDKGELTEEDTSKRVSKEGIIREMEIDIVMSIGAAQALSQLLRQNLDVAFLSIAEAKPTSSHP